MTVFDECIERRRNLSLSKSGCDAKGKDPFEENTFIHLCRGRPRRLGPMKKNSIIYIFLSESHADKHADFLPRTYEGFLASYLRSRT